MSDSVRPHRQKPIRLPRPWDSPGKNTGVGCHFLLQCMKVKSESEVAKSRPTLSDLMDCSLPGSSVHGIFQARVLEWGAIAFSELAFNSILFCISPISSVLVCLYFSCCFVDGFCSVFHFISALGLITKSFLPCPSTPVVALVCIINI